MSEPSGRPVEAPPVRHTWYWAALVGILLIAAGLRVYRLGAESFWIDEIYMLEYTAGKCHAEFALPRDVVIDSPPRLTSLEGAGSVVRIWGSLKDDQHPPLYYVALRLWRDVLGSSDVAFRSLSVVASLAAIVLLFDVGRLLFSPGAALWACALMAVAQVQIRYAQEARSYMVLTALVLAAADALVRIERLGWSRWRAAGLGAAMLGVVLTHYFGVAGCAALGVYALVRLRGRERWWTVGTMAGAAAVYAVVWGPFAYQQMHGYAAHSEWLFDRPGSPRLMLWGRRLLYGPIRLFADASRRSGALPLVGVVILLLPLLRLRKVPGLLLPTLWALGWFAFVAALDLARGTQVLNYPRYLLGAAPAAYLMVAGLMWDRRGWVRHVLPAAMVLYCVVSLPWTYDDPKAEWRVLGRHLAESATDEDLILYYAPGAGDWYAAVMYMAVEHYAPGLRAPVVIVTQPLSSAAIRRAHEARTVWLAHDASPVDADDLAPGFDVAETRFLWGLGALDRLTARDGRDTSSSPTGRGR